MSQSTNVPQISITPEGVTTPTTEAIFNGVLQDYNVAFGGNLNIENVATPQGVLASEQSQAIALQNGNIALTLTQFDPATAEGRYQDAIGNIYFITRNPATSTVVSATCTGSPGVILPVGSQAKDTQGYIYSSLGAATFNELGQATVQFANDTKGEISCPINSLIYIETAVSGWDAITNTTAGILGSDVESRIAFERRRFASVAGNAQGSTVSIYGAVSGVSNVLDCVVVENDTNATVNYGSTNYPLAPHSVFVGVIGGLDSAIANAIWNKKSTGCATNGNTSVTIYDTTYSSPQPAYTINFNRPTNTPVYITVTLAANALLPSNIDELVINAIQTSFTGTGATDRVKMGSTLYASRFYSGVASIDSSINIVDIHIGTSASPTGDTITFGIDQAPTLDNSNIVLVIQ